MFHQVQQAIDPNLSLKSVLENWYCIQKDLAEEPRQRMPQLDSYEKYFSTG